MSGFTLIELLVVIGIMVVISALVLADYNKFGGVVVLEQLSYDVALTLRQAQVFGISVQRFQTNTFDAAYGVHFALSSPDTYELFADAIQKNGLYDCPSPGTNNCELVQAVTLPPNYAIHDLCATNGSGTQTCGLTSLDIVFKRPDTDAWISANGANCLNGGQCSESATMTLKSPRGDTMNVVVTVNGQISVTTH